MPVYVYECTKCGEKLEVMQRIKDKPLSTCTKCSGHLKKVLTPTSFVLKGTGWYVTDYPSEDRKRAIAGDKPKGKHTKDKSKEDTSKENKSKEDTSKEEPKSKEPAEIS